MAAAHSWLPGAMLNHHVAPQLPMDLTSAAFAAIVTVYYWWQNLKGIEESSDKALEVMKITTVMVVILLTWGIYSAFHVGAKLPPWPTPSNLHFSKDALGFLGYTKLPAMLGLFGVIMAFGHSVLAMSGEETLAQVNREIEHPKLKNLKRAAIVIAIYSFLFTGLGSLLAVMLIPDSVRVPVYRDNLIAGMAMYMVGPQVLRIIFRVFVVLVGFLILSGAINTSIIGSTGVLMRIAEDGVLTDWFRRPHHKFGTSYRIVNLVAGMQLFTIIASRGNVIALGEAYAFGVIWSFTFNSLAMLVLRWKYKGERGWKVPPNLRIGKREIPIGLISVFMVLLTTAIVNLFTKSVATVSGILFAATFFIIFTISERDNRRRRTTTELQMKEHFQLEHEDTVGRDVLEINPGCVVVTMRDADQPLRAQVDAVAHQYRRSGCRCADGADGGRRRPGVALHLRSALQRIRADAVYQGSFRCGELWQAHLAAGGARRGHLRRPGADGQFAGSGGGGVGAFQQDVGARAGLPRRPGVGGAAGAQAADHLLRGLPQWRGGVVPHWPPCALPAGG